MFKLLDLIIILFMCCFFCCFSALAIHHIKRTDEAVATQREIHTLKMKLQEIMKGAYVYLHVHVVRKNSMFVIYIHIDICLCVFCFFFFLSFSSTHLKWNFGWCTCCTKNLILSSSCLSCFFFSFFFCFFCCCLMYGDLKTPMKVHAIPLQYTYNIHTCMYL